MTEGAAGAVNLSGDVRVRNSLGGQEVAVA